MKEHTRVCAKINLQAVLDNFSMMHGKLKPDTKICAVVKTDAYGHGAVPVARTVEKLPYIWGFATATAAEALELREAGITKPVLVLGYVFPEDYPLLADYDIRPAVFDLASARALSETALSRGRIIRFHFAVDTGMSRIGLTDTAEGAAAAAAIAALPGLEAEGIFTHFARADEEDKQNVLAALERFRKFTLLLEENGISVPIRHCSNSACILELPEAHYDMVRAGITIYGIYPSDEMKREISPLSPVMELISHVSFVKEISAGTSVSYGGTFTAEKDMTVATIPVGYGDGYPRSLSNCGYVLIHGKKAPILGRICMDQFMVDVSGMDVRPSDQVVLMGKDGDEEISVDTLGRLSGRFPYEFVCDITKRVPRVYLKGGSGAGNGC